MTMTGNTEETIRDSPVSYLELVDFIQDNGINIEENLQQLWRRIVFNIAISNTDDHLRNHGFILASKGWILSPAYDLNPSIDKDGLALSIDTDNNALDYELAKSVGEYFRLDKNKMDEIINEVLEVVSTWKEVANTIGISNKERVLMDKAFNV
jgi:serine/threonine-protein kinase HipA